MTEERSKTVSRFCWCPIGKHQHWCALKARIKPNRFGEYIFACHQCMVKDQLQGHREQIAAEPAPAETFTFHHQQLASFPAVRAEARQRHPGMLLLFHLGDFYELFDEDAQLAHRVLGLTLTVREGASMAGFPCHHLETYLRQLLQAGHRVALCDPVE
jgi:Zn-finger protein